MTHLIDTYGYWALALVVLAESFGVPLPGETAVIVASTYAGTSHRLSPWLIFLVAAAAAIAGGIFGYGIGRAGGFRLVRRYGSKIHLDARNLRLSKYLFDTYGTMVVFFGRFVSILRTYAAFLAGTTEMSWPRFVTANVAGAVAWAAIYTSLAYLAGNTLRRISTPVDIAFAGVAVVVVVLSIVLIRRRTAALHAKADAAYPDFPD